MGTWNMGDDPARRADELATLRLGLNRGASLIDTAEMYGDGRAEELVAEAVAGRRDEAFIVSKVYPHNASSAGMSGACERSLQRLRTDRIDLYLLHWRGDVPFAETIDALLALQRAGKIRHFGVSNLDLTDMQEWMTVPGGSGLQTNQVLYNLGRRGIEWDLLPWLRERRIPVMAYSPLEQGRMMKERALRTFAREAGRTPAQVALAWLMRDDDVMVIPKASTPARLEENLRAAELRLSATQLAALDRLYPPPTRAEPLAML